MAAEGERSHGWGWKGRRSDIRLALIAAAVLAIAFLGCEGHHVRPERFRKLTDVDRPDCRVGAWEGHDSEVFARRLFPNAAIIPYEEPEDAFVALLAGQAEAFVADEHILNVARRAYPHRFRILDFALERSPAVVTVSARRKDLLADVNRFIAAYRRDGTYDAMYARWCQGDVYVPMPPIEEATNAVACLRVGTSGLSEPSTFIDRDGRLTGYDIEFARRLARWLGRRVSFVLKPDGAFDAELRSGAVDIVVDNVDETPPRAGIAFSDGYMDADMKVMVASADEALSESAVVRMLDRTNIGMTDALVPNPWIRLFLKGLLNTLALFFLAALLARPVTRYVRGRAAHVVALVRWVPPPVLLLFLSAAAGSLLPTFVAAVASLAIHHAAVRLGEPERPYAETLAALLPWTSVVGLVNVFDLTMAADLLGGRLFGAVVPLAGVALAYVILARIVIRVASRPSEERP